MRYCGVLYCPQKGPTDKLGNKVTYHRVPANDPHRKLWIQKIRRRDYLYNSVSNIFVCSLHFNETDFMKNVASNKRRLLDGVAPSKFKWKPFEDQDHNKSEREIIPSANMEIDMKLPNEDSTNATASEIFNPDKILDLTGNKELSELTEVEMMAVRGSLCPENALELENNRLKSLVADLSLTVKLQEKRISLMEYKIKEVEQLLEEERTKCQNLENKFTKSKFGINMIKESDSDVHFYTGIPNYTKLMALFEFLNPGPNGENIVWWRGKNTKENSTSPAGRPRKLDVLDQFLIVLMRMRLGLFVKDLAHRFQVSESTISATCISWLNFMYLQLAQINIWQSREQIDATMPQEFKDKYPSTRCVIDATEIKCQVPKSLVLQTATYSNYKSTNTYKGLIGISPEGYVTFVSALYTGNISDKELTKKSGFLSMDFAPQDSVMADKGFLLEDLLKPLNVTLNIPPFLRENNQFSKEEVIETHKIAKLRIHVERRINRIKNYHIFDRPIPITLAPVINQLWTVAALLTNFQNPLIASDSSIVLNTTADELDYYTMSDFEHLPVNEDEDFNESYM